MRARNLKPSLYDNEVLGTADPLLTILFTGLWCAADRLGRLEDRPLRIRAQIFPYRDSVDIESQLVWLHDNGFIKRYIAKGLKLIQVLTFSDHQRPHTNEVASVLPSLDEADTTKVRRTSNQGDKSGSPRRQALRSDSGLLTPDCLNLTPDSNARVRAFDPDMVPGLSLEAWNRWVEYRIQRKPAIKAASMQAAAEELAAFGIDQITVVKKSIAAGYQGLFAPKTNGSGAHRPQSRVPKTLAELEAEEANAQH